MTSDSSLRPWTRFLLWFCGATLLLGCVLVGLIVWANPYRNIPFASSDRPLMDVNQRYLYPAVARDPRFDSAVLGNSTIRLLRPELLNQTLGGQFAQLAMNSGTAWEEWRMARFFLSQRAQPRTVILGLDSLWCSQNPDDRLITERGFPEWMYDDNPWNDLLNLFNGKVIEIAGRILTEAVTGEGKIHFDQTGYGNFLPPRTDYDLTRAREHIYGQAMPVLKAPVVPPVVLSEAERQALVFPTHALMQEFLTGSPAETQVILMWVPYHAVGLPATGSREEGVLETCKQRVTALAKARPHTMVVDFMIRSDITTRDENYWDSLHYDTAIADRVVSGLGQALRGESSAAGDYRLLDAME